MMASNILGNINLDADELNLPVAELVYLLLHEANHSKQLSRNFFDRRRFSKKGMFSLELEATLQSCYDMGLVTSYGAKDFLLWELDYWIIRKYGIGLPEFAKQVNRVVKWAKIDQSKKHQKISRRIG